MKANFQKKKFFNPQTKIVDARLLIKSKSRITDAREKIKAKPVVDARQKLQQKKIENNSVKKTPITGNGNIPKVTILNDLAHPERQHGIPQISFHVTQSVRGHHTRNNPNLGHTVSSRAGTGIKIAVRNELARPKPKPRTLPQSDRKKFERLKITTINKNAIKKAPPSPISSPSKTIRKRSLPKPEPSYEETPTLPKQRRQQKSPEVQRPILRKSVKTETNTPRPMISRHDASPRTSTSRKEEVEEEENQPVGPSPIEGTKLRVLNLHPVVTEDDILELFSVLGAVRRARLVKPGEAEVVYIKHENAFAAYKKYNNRDLDGQPMQIKLLMNDSPKRATTYSWMKEVKSSRKKSDPSEVTELHSGVLQQALFKGGSTGTSTRPVVFTVKI